MKKAIIALLLILAFTVLMVSCDKSVDCGPDEENIPTPSNSTVTSSDLSNDKEDVKRLYSILATINNEEDVEIFFGDLCTYKELDSMAQRIEAAELLLKGETSGQITQKIDISSATLSRVSRCVKYGQGYKKFLQGK